MTQLLVVSVWTHPTGGQEFVAQLAVVVSLEEEQMINFLVMSC